MEIPPPSKIRQDTDRISALPDELLLDVLERLSLRDAVRTGAASTRWRHLPHQLSRLCLDIGEFQRTTLLAPTMDAFTGAVCRLLLPACSLADRKCDFKIRRVVKTLRLRFYLSDTHLSSIGRAVEETVSHGETDHFEFEVLPQYPDLIPVLGDQFMSFSRSCPIAFRWLTSLSLRALLFGDSDLSSLIRACDKLKHLSLRSCRLIGHSVLKIDVPNSIIHELEFINFRCTRIDLVSVPKLSRMLCHRWQMDNPPLHFGYVPELLTVDLDSRARAWQAAFALSDCFSMNTSSISKLDLILAEKEP